MPPIAPARRQNRPPGDPVRERIVASDAVSACAPLTSDSAALIKPQPSSCARGPLLAYALPYLSIGMIMMPVATIAPNLYVKERGVSLASMGVVLMFARIFDAVSDQTVGYISDITRERLPGGRKAWLVLGALVAIPSVYLLFTPPQAAGIAYFAVGSLASYLAWSLLLIPYLAWGAELTRGYHERTRITTVRSIFGQAGTFLFLAMPLALNALHLAPSTSMTLQATHYVALALVALLPVTILPALLFVSGGTKPAARTQASLGAAIRSLRVNRPMQIFFGALLVSELGYGIFATVIFLYIDAYLGLGAKFSYIIIMVNIGTLLSLPAWEWICRLTSKKTAITASWLLQGILLVPFVFIPRGESGFAPLIAVIVALAFFGGAGVVVSPSLLGDIVDYDTLKTRGYRAGNYFALYSLVDKFAVAVGGGVAFELLSLFHYDAVHPTTNTPSANAAMLGVFACVPAALRLASLALLARYPLDARRQGIIRRRLDQRETRAARAASASSAASAAAIGVLP
jgi:GPH family glycoside/pentoside/hexuronide:cation symporter